MEENIEFRSSTSGVKKWNKNMCFRISLFCTVYNLFILILIEFLSAVP